MNKKHLGLISLLCATLLLGGCGTKSDIKKYVVGELSTFSSAGCEAVHLNTLILSKTKAYKFIDNRTEQERNYHNSLWTPEEYCAMSDFSFNQIVAEFGKKTAFNSPIQLRENQVAYSSEKSLMVVEFQGTNRKYATTRNFNFAKIKGESYSFFKEGSSQNFGKGLNYKIYSIREFKDGKRLWQLKLVDKKGNEQIINLDKNYFYLGDYKVVF